MPRPKRTWRTEWSVTRALAVRFGGVEYVPASALERGTLVHQWTEAYDHGLSPKMPVGYEGYCFAYQQFCAEKRPTWTLIEQEVEDVAVGYHGILDRFGFLGDDPLHTIVADIKTGPPREADALQLAAYAHPFEVPGIKTKRIGIYIKDDGTWSLKLYDDPRDWVEFQVILNEAKATKEAP